MKYSELKAGDHIRRVGGPDNPCICRVVTTPPTDMRSCIVVVAGTGAGGCDLYPGAATQCGSGHEVELVPMPHTKEHPYVIGKAYRTRSGERATYTSNNKQHNKNTYPFIFTKPNNKYFSITAEGYWCAHTDHRDIMGEWEEKAAFTQCPPAIRSLPTVTLDQIFEVLKEKGACWYKELGPVKLVYKLNQITPSAGNAPLNLANLNNAVQTGHISPGEAAWLANALGEKILPTAIKGEMGAKCMWGTTVLLEVINNWVKPQRTLRDYPPGTRFMYRGHPHVIVDGSGYTLPSPSNNVLVINLSDGKLNRILPPTDQISNIVDPK
jgi:hypothetical protein